MAETTLAPSEVTHLVVTRSDEGWFAESPRVLGLAMGRPTETEFRRDYRKVLRDVGVSGAVQGHVQGPGVTPEGREYLIRWAEGPDLAERLELGRRLEAVLDTDQRVDVLNVEPTATGEVVFVMALASDTLGFFMDQLFDERDALVLCASVAEQGLFTLTLASGKARTEGWATPAECGWDRETTVTQLLVDEAAGRRPQRLLV